MNVSFIPKKISDKFVIVYSFILHKSGGVSIVESGGTSPHKKGLSDDVRKKSARQASNQPGKPGSITHWNDNGFPSLTKGIYGKADFDV
jgi:hypothetical protein